MVKSKEKRQRIRLESQVQRLLHKDNGVTAHFDYHIKMNSAEHTVELRLLTFNPVHDDYMLLRKVSGASSIDCLQAILSYLREYPFAKTEYSYTVNWKLKHEKGGMHQSYFRGTSEAEVLNKFLHEKNAADYEFSIHQNPIS